MQLLPLIAILFVATAASAARDPPPAGWVSTTLKSLGSSYYAPSNISNPEWPLDGEAVIAVPKYASPITPANSVWIDGTYIGSISFSSNTDVYPVSMTFVDYQTPSCAGLIKVTNPMSLNVTCMNYDNLAYAVFLSE